jgi:inner membrane transporter RhtA
MLQKGSSFARGLDRVGGTVPPTGLVLLAVGCFQLGAAIAKGLFDSVGPAGAVFLRVGFAALILLLMWRPRLGGYARSDYGLAVVFGLALAGMNFAFYSALERIPLGVAVTLEFAGPLTVAVAGSRRLIDLLWAALAAAGILLLAPLNLFGSVDLDPVGVALALLAGTLWGSYILLSSRTGRVFPGGTGLAIAMCVGALALVPVGVAEAGYALLDPGVLLVGFGVAMLSSAVPYSLEMEALRKLPARVFGVLMSLEPAVAALIGFVVLGERLGLRAIAAVVLVTTAAVGASRFADKSG